MLFSRIRKRRVVDEEPTPVLLFHHIAKTAGTSLRKILQKNYKKKELLELYGPNRASVEWYQSYYDSMPAKQKASVKCIAAHTAHYIIPVLDRPFQVFTLLRDPLDRVISLFYFAKEIAYSGQGRGAELGREINRLGWNLEEIYSNLGGGYNNTSERHSLFDTFFDGQARVILAPHYPVQEMQYQASHMNRDRWREKELFTLLEEHYTVGVQAHYRDSIERFSQAFGWKRVFYEEKNKTKSRPRLEELSAEAADLIRSYNQLDMRIYDYYSQQFQQ